MTASTTTEVAAFIEQAHRKTGAPGLDLLHRAVRARPRPSPHGVKDPQTLKPNDVVLIDTGCRVP